MILRSQIYLFKESGSAETVLITFYLIFLKMACIDVKLRMLEVKINEEPLMNHSRHSFISLTRTHICFEIVKSRSH